MHRCRVQGRKAHVPSQIRPYLTEAVDSRKYILIQSELQLAVTLHTAGR